MTSPDPDAPPRDGRAPSLFRHHDFRQVWMGDTVSVFGVEIVGFAIPIIAVTVLAATELQMGLLATAEMLAFLLIGLPAGAWVDRMRKKHVIIRGDLLRAALLLTLPAAWALDMLSMTQLYVVVFLVGCITVFFDVANQSYLPEIVASDQISEGNAKLSASQQTARVAGPTVAAWLLRVIGAPWAVGVTALFMALSALFVSRVRTPSARPNPALREPLAQEIRAGLAFVVRHPLLVRIVACTGLSNFANAITTTLFVLFAIRELGITETDLGLLFSVMAVGGILGAISSDRLARVLGEGRIIPLSALTWSVAMFSLPLSAYVSSPMPLLMAGGFLGGGLVVVYNVTQVSFRQRLCPPHLLGRMNGSIRFLVWGPIPVAAFLAGVLGQQFGALTTMWIGATLGMLSALPVLLSPLVRMRELPCSLDALSGDGAH
ncbi:MAG: MFS transporter [Dermatophilaceae bacterium]|nr:MFS transporter [Intrasporangiaceae bacterium]